MEKALRKNKRPHLRHSSPVVFFAAWGYAVTNLLIGLGIWHTSAAALMVYPFVREPFGPHFYGATFFLMGSAGIFTLTVGWWRWVRRVMMFGLLVKSLFFYGLLLNISWQILSILGIWALITFLQFLTVVYFPKDKKERFDGAYRV